MQITISIQLAIGDSINTAPDNIANKVLTALGGDPTKDYASVVVQMSPLSGSAGTSPASPITSPPLSP